MFTIRSNTRKNMTENEVCAGLTITLLIAVVTSVPLLIVGKAYLFPGLAKYRDIEQQTCFGANQIQNYSITPLVYNTTLTYYPAFLHATVTVQTEL